MKLSEGIAVLIILVVIGIVISIFFKGCKQVVARRVGGTVEVVLPVNQKVVNVTWKDSNIWVLTKPNVEKVKPEIYEFKEYSKFGILQGKVLIKETE